MRFIIMTLLLLSLLANPMVLMAAQFAKAQPVWLTGREKEMNVFAGYCAVVNHADARKVVLRVTAASIYRASVNGEFVGHGPARAAHGFYRIDEYDIAPLLKRGKNIVAIEVAGYNSNSYYLLNQPSFVQAEVLADSRPIAFTSGESGGFAARALPYRVQKVQRTSFQRPFAEAYQLQPSSTSWQTDPAAEFPAESISETEKKNLLPRGVSYPRFTRIQPRTIVSTGATTESPSTRDNYKDRSLTQTGPKLAGYPQDQLDAVISRDLAGNVTASSTPIHATYNPKDPLPLSAEHFAILDLGINLTGFIGATVDCKSSTTLLFAFDEMIRNGDVESLRLGMVGGIRYDLAPGSYDLESIEPHNMRYVKLMALEGDCTVTSIVLREYAADDVWEAAFSCSDPRLERIFNAGRQTYRQNSVDIFMDCPHRERAGWLCDSFFTARAAADLTGGAAVERNFLENFALPETFQHIPEGMLPMCYPADHDDGVYIPNWAMWFVVELEEYFKRSGDHGLVTQLEPRVMKLLNFLARYKNSDGLLEKLESWVFVEWSKANEWVQDVNYPSNMLYAGTLDAAARLYNRPELAKTAAAIRETIRRQSFKGEFFVDNAMRRGDKLEITTNTSEVCQYFAFFFGVATPETHADLWKKLRDQFGPNRAANDPFPHVAKANAFIGNILRMDLLGRFGVTRELPNQLIGYYLKMADETGTIWENDSTVASLNHGFGAHVVHTLYQDVLGIHELDAVNKRVRFRVPENDLQWCNGRIPTPDGFVEFQWQRTATETKSTHSVPAGYVVTD